MELILSLLTTFLLTLIVGRFIRAFTSLQSLNGFLALFADLTIGFYLLVSLFSVVKTGGITINSILILWVITFGLIFRVFKKPNFTVFTEIKTKYLLEGTLILLLFFVWNYLELYNPKYDSAVVLNLDALSDVTRAIFLNYNGIENSSTNVLMSPNGTQPYHYFESWSVAGIASLFNTNYWIAQNAIFHPLILSIIYIGFRATTNKNPFNLTPMLFGISLFFASGYLIDSMDQLPFFEWTDALKNNVIDEPWWTRLSVLYPIILSAYLLYRNELTSHSIVILMIIPFLSVTPAIPIIIATFGLIFFGLIFKRNLIVFNWKHLLIPVFAAVLYKTFYSIFKENSDFIKLPTIADILNANSDVSNLKTKAFILIEKLFQTFILFSPLILFAIISHFNRIVVFVRTLRLSKSWVTIAIFILLLILVSSAMWQILDFIFGSSFFYYYTIIPFLNITFIIIIWEGIKDDSYSFKKVTVLSSMIILLFLQINRSYQFHVKAETQQYSNVYSPSFINKINNLVKKHNLNKGLQIGVKIENPREIVHPFFNDGLSLCGYYLYGIMDAPSLISLSRTEIPKEKLEEQPYYKSFTLNSTFYMFVNRQNALEDSIKIQFLKRDFVQKNSIRFGVVSAQGAIPESLKDLIYQIIEDPKSKEKFILFK